MAWYKQNRISVDFSPAHVVRDEMWAILMCKLLLHLYKIKYGLPLCMVNIFMMTTGTECIVGGMGFAAVSHYVPNILSVMMCCILLLFCILLEHCVISCNSHSICETAKRWGFFPSLKAFRSILTWSVSFLLGTKVHFLVASASPWKGKHCYHPLT